MLAAERKDSVNVVARYEVGPLLEQAGARPRGNRHDCPKCGGLRTITHTDECFFCHKCQWKGNAITLAKELGIYRRLPSAEYKALRWKRRRGHDAARRLYAAARTCQLDLREEFRYLGQLEDEAHKAGPNSPMAWDMLAEVYAKRPAIEAELEILESDNAAAAFTILMANAGKAQET